MLLNTPEEEVELGDLHVSEIAGENRAAKFDLELAMSERQNDLYCSLVYNTDLFDRARMEELLRQYRSLLEQAAARPDVRTGSYSLLTAEARTLLPDPRAPLGEEWIGAVHELFRQRAERRDSPSRTPPLRWCWRSSPFSWRSVGSRVRW